MRGVDAVHHDATHLQSYMVEHMEMVEEDCYFYGLVLSHKFKGFFYVLAVEKFVDDVLHTMLLATNDEYTPIEHEEPLTTAILHNEGMEGVMTELGYSLQRGLH